MLQVTIIQYLVCTSGLFVTNMLAASVPKDISIVRFDYPSIPQTNLDLQVDGPENSTMDKRSKRSNKLTMGNIKRPKSRVKSAYIRGKELAMKRAKMRALTRARLDPNYTEPDFEPDIFYETNSLSGQSKSVIVPYPELSAWTLEQQDVSLAEDERIEFYTEVQPDGNRLKRIIVDL